MPQIPGRKCLTFRTYIVSARRTMTVEWFWEPESAVLGADLTAAANDYTTAFVQQMATLMPDQVTLQTTQAIYEDDTTYQDRFNDNGPVTGLAVVTVLEPVGSVVLPDQDAVIFQKRTGLPGRQHRGRMFLPCLWEGFNNEGLLHNSAVAPALGLATLLGADHLFGAILCHSRHWNRKDNTLDVVTEVRPLRNLGSRRDRQPHAPNIPVT